MKNELEIIINDMYEIINKKLSSYSIYATDIENWFCSYNEWMPNNNVS